MSRTINSTITELRARFPMSDYAAVAHFLPETTEVEVYAHGGDLDEVTGRAVVEAPPLGGVVNTFCILVLRPTERKPA